MNAIWVLVIFAHVGIIGSGNSNALTSVDGFKTKEACEAAGRAVKAMEDGTVKVVKFTCVQR